MKRHAATRSSRGMSLPEILIAISIVAILTMIAIPAYMGYFESSRAGIASSLVETVNSSVQRFNQANYELAVPPGDGTNADVEISIIRTLQYRRTDFARPGSPYIDKRWNPVASASSNDYRLQWKGRRFVLLAPGTTGAGLKVDFGGGDMGTPYSYPSSFQMAGS